MMRHASVMTPLDGRALWDTKQWEVPQISLCCATSAALVPLCLPEQLLPLGQPRHHCRIRCS